MKKIIKNHDIHNDPTRTAEVLRILNHSTSVLKVSPEYAGVQFNNLLPINIKDVIDVKRLKAVLENHLVEN